MKLTDTQRVILSTASQRTDRLALPLPGKLKGGAVNMIVKSMLKNGLLEEVEANRKLNDPIWRETGDGHAVTLIVSDAGLAAIGVEPEGQPKAEPAPAERKPREGTKQAAMIELLRRADGATIEEIAAATGWQKHTIRGAMAGALKKKLGLDIASDKVEGRGRVYKIAA
jgi:hypothetical protein